QRQNKKENRWATPNRNSSPTYRWATPNRNSSPTYRWATPFTRSRKENSFGKFVKFLNQYFQLPIIEICSNSTVFVLLKVKYMNWMIDLYVEKMIR
ncbi:hypothetical protein, partial [Bacillus sp. AY1-10]|uniref:hypothetical protein n=1 Tax=Bacillus sp. AY1-10 TaxID=2217823 RepID=UPI001C552F0D